ncbi:3-hydroxybutyryl-CoA dehydrogenase [Cnuella takakiae]|uniref:3-hydroxybutyryl-CoA dehydrogenase n=1 Tax=Cnuella takakiae TaxID=1302690 RepID=A0A1M5D879_9BACT|nr:3-hydroxyacyl-CoA dehydrogenase NAD-binding domain-containing protein [Cnuella takakiae]OLY94071.1 3-hydroxybutyryl-CoA dehydrogenase [Cnuella takakiae]SHF63233.1 3-hydroxybutyryl-CoA dehydrogenase [Cnuella takakiae]
MNIHTIAVCGAGTMGRGIAQVCAAAGFTTLVYDPNEPVLEIARQELEALIAKGVAKGKLTEQAGKDMWEKLRFTSDINLCKAHLVIEAIVEQPEAKQQLFTQLAAINEPDTLLASNTSSLSITRLAATLPHPERFAGLHFFNPAALMPLVEVVQGAATAAATIETLLQLVRHLGKTPVRCADAPGFIVNRVARPYYIEALRLAEAGTDLAQIDRILEDKGFRMGPFRLMDLIGNDVNYAVSCSVYAQLGQPERLKPSYLQEVKVKEGELGKKTGKGFYEW